MSSSHFSSAHLGTECSNQTQNKPAVGYPIISTELSSAIFIYLIRFYSHRDLHLLSILLTTNKKYCYYNAVYTTAIITHPLTGSEIKPRFLMSLQSVQWQYKTKHDTSILQISFLKNPNILIKRFQDVSTARPQVNKWFCNIRRLFHSGTE